MPKIKGNGGGRQKRKVKAPLNPYPTRKRQKQGNEIPQEQVNISEQQSSTLSAQSSTNIESRLSDRLEARFQSLESRFQAMEDCQDQVQALSKLEETHSFQKEQIRILEHKLIEEKNLRKKLHNTFLELKGNIRLFCRVRPLLTDDGGAEGAVVSYPTSMESLGLGMDLIQSGQKHPFTTRFSIIRLHSKMFLWRYPSWYRVPLMDIRFVYLLMDRQVQVRLTP